jgi:hypothetical protein
MVVSGYREIGSAFLSVCELTKNSREHGGLGDEGAHCCKFFY